MSKAYDRIKWNLILLPLKLFGFSPRQISWIQECLSSVSYSILLEGTPHDFIIPTRGLRQGDPLSPFSFVIGIEILSRMLDKAQDLSLLKGVHLSRGGPPISPLLYANDVLLFGHAYVEEARIWPRNKFPKILYFYLPKHFWRIC